jgi:hypothetical protein
MPFISTIFEAVISIIPPLQVELAWVGESNHPQPMLRIQ